MFLPPSVCRWAWFGPVRDNLRRRFGDVVGRRGLVWGRAVAVWGRSGTLLERAWSVWCRGEAASSTQLRVGEAPAHSCFILGCGLKMGVTPCCCGYSSLAAGFTLFQSPLDRHICVRSQHTHVYVQHNGSVCQSLRMKASAK